jgi:hypothetical protein
MLVAETPAGPSTSGSRYARAAVRRDTRSPRSTPGSWSPTVAPRPVAPDAPSLVEGNLLLGHFGIATVPALYGSELRRLAPDSAETRRRPEDSRRHERRVAALSPRAHSRAPPGHPPPPSSVMNADPVGQDAVGPEALVERPRDDLFVRAQGKAALAPRRRPERDDRILARRRSDIGAGGLAGGLATVSGVGRAGRGHRLNSITTNLNGDDRRTSVAWFHVVPPSRSHRPLPAQDGEAGTRLDVPIGHEAPAGGGGESDVPSGERRQPSLL